MRSNLFWSIAVISSCLTVVPVAAGLPQAAPAEVGLSAERLANMEPLIEQGIADQLLPGCVVCVGRQGKIAWLKAYGNRQLQPVVVPMTTDTLFDMASITKPVATATSIVWLVEQGRLRLDDKVARHLPEFGIHGKEAITIQDLLLHQSGLLADNALADYQQGPEVAFERIFNLKLSHPVGSRFLYSDVNFLVLGHLVQRVSEQSLHEFSRRRIFNPLGMTETGFLPSPELQAKAAPTQQREGRWMQGEVHDPRAYALGGVAGHAGLFSTAADMAVYAQMLLNAGEYDGARVLQPETVATMTRRYPVSSGFRGLGWDQQTGFSINRGSTFSEAAFGHGGFTGTVLWIDPSRQLFFLFLSNRVHPDGKGLVNPLAGKIGSIVGAAVQDDD